MLVFYDQSPDLTGAVRESWDAVREGIIAGAALSPAATIVSSTLPELLDDEAAWRFIQAGIPAIAGLRTGPRCAAALGSRARRSGAAARDRARLRHGPWAPRRRLEWLSEHDAKELLRGAGVARGRGPGRVATRTTPWPRSRELGGDIALKLSAPTIQHKSDVGAIELGLRVGGRRCGARSRGLPRSTPARRASVLAERMAAPGVELIVAARADAVVPALVIGLGGVWTEMLGDVAIVPLPAGAARIESGTPLIARRAAVDGRAGHAAGGLSPRWRGWPSGSARSSSRSRSS